MVAHQRSSHRISHRLLLQFCTLGLVAEVFRKMDSAEQALPATSLNYGINRTVVIRINCTVETILIV